MLWRRKALDGGSVCAVLSAAMLGTAAQRTLRYAVALLLSACRVAHVSGHVSGADAAAAPDAATLCDGGERSLPSPRTANRDAGGIADAACTANADCDRDLACLEAASGGALGVCRVAPAAFEPCAVAFAPADAPCEGAACAACGRDLYCAASGECEQRPTIGQPCALARDATVAAACVDLAYCDTTYSPPLCLPLPLPGAPCAPVMRGAFGWVADGVGVRLPFGCSDGYCGCEQGGGSCTEPLCIRTRAIGDSCRTRGDSCQAGALCGDAGICERAEGDVPSVACERM